MDANEIFDQTEDAMTRFQRWALRVSALTFAVLLMTACGSEETADRSATNLAK